MNAHIYKNTGITSENLPDTPARVSAWGAEISAPVLDILQSHFLESISVRTTWADIKDADYVEVDGFYYTVAGITMTSYDVARIALTPDFLTSAGGPAAIEYLDGVTVRKHVAKSTDAFGAYTEADEYLNPAQPLILEYYAQSAQPTYYHLVESSLDLYAMGNGAAAGKTYTDSTSGETVTVPAPVYTTQRTTFRLGPTATSPTTDTIGTAVFNADNVVIQAGIQEARNLGVEDGIIAAWQVPDDLITVTWATAADGTEWPWALYITDVKTPITPTGVSAYEYASPHNERVLYGSPNRWGILTANGNRAEYNPEDIYNSGDTRPNVLSRADGRSDGSPYYRFQYLNGSDGDTTNSSFFQTCVQGSTWRNLPIRFVQASGEKIAGMSYDSSRAISELGQAHTIAEQQAEGSRMILSDLGNIGGGIFSALTGDVTGVGQALGRIPGEYADLVEMTARQDRQREMYAAQRAHSIRERAMAKNAVAPQIVFPYGNPSVRDYVGNGATIYRYRYRTTDLDRVDRLLTMYGYRVTGPLTASDFNTRTNFNFVQAEGVSVQNSAHTLPIWWSNGIAAQLAGGIRVWHVKPDASYYNENLYPNN